MLPHQAPRWGLVAASSEGDPSRPPLTRSRTGTPGAGPWDMRLKRVVAAVDLSAPTAVVVEAAAALARAFGATVDVLHVREPVRDTLKRMTQPPVETGPHEEIDRALDALVERLVEQGIAAVSTSLEGVPSKRIVDHARKTSSDLILLATHGRTGAAHALLGSVAERVAQHASCAVLILPVRPGPAPP